MRESQLEAKLEQDKIIHDRFKVMRNTLDKIKREGMNQVRDNQPLNLNENYYEGLDYDSD